MVDARSRVRGIAWPALLDEEAAKLLSVQLQLSQSQWWSSEKLREQQLVQLAEVVKHARETVPHYAGLVDELERMPILTRAMLTDAPASFVSSRVPPEHGESTELSSSRTTGKPVRVRQTRVGQLMWHALTLREHLWHERDLSRHLAAIRYAPPSDVEALRGARQRGWGPAVDLIYPRAPVSILHIGAPLEEQVAWLLREDPDYLLVYPTVLGEILRHLRRSGERPRRLRQVRTTSEALGEDTRLLCRDVLGVPLVDIYSAQEVGYLALQCPAHEHYHVQSESVIVEVLDDAGAPCRAGELGRVVVTALHNFATPLIRYELGDYAEVGEACPCGRGLPVLRRILGRRRGMLTYPGGHRAWPVFTVACREAASYRQIQIEQREDLSLIVRIVPEGDFTDRDRRAIADALEASFGHAFPLTIEIVRAIPRGPTGKLEELISRA